MSRQLGPAALVIAAGLADAAGRSDLALYALLAAVPAIAAVALKGYGDLVSGDGGNALETSLWVVALLLVTAGASVPTFWSTALVTCLGLIGLQGALALSAELRRT
jgi:Ca2+/H+ antiporter